ncbi:hypothetical protein B0H17DRAFT_1237260 [Mycena rosella]|uniref:Uncharacterized protein n=1 Tax=Mycena rosella TaxID=1033263 RepID=A0AAD7GNF1_MYCRO|nr:hypothetical protein B0H17DRAFT_1237260 [Mycena rosella]
MTRRNGTIVPDATTHPHILYEGASSPMLSPLSTRMSYTAPTRSSDAFWLLRDLVMVIRELATTVVLCYLTTLGLLRFIAQHLNLFVSPPGCDSKIVEAYRRVLSDITCLEVLRVTTGYTLVGFAAVELSILLARRAGLGTTADAEKGIEA